MDNKATEDLVFNTRQTQKKIAEAKAEFAAVREMEPPLEGDSDAEFRRKATAAIVALFALAEKQEAIFDAATRTPEYPGAGDE